MRTNNKKQIKKILVIRFRRVGDAVLTTALCNTLKNSFPEAKLHYVLNESIACLFQQQSFIDNVITFNEKENKNILRYIAKVSKIMSNEHYDLIIDCRSTVRTLLFSLFSLKTPYRLGEIKKYNRFILNYRTSQPENCSTIHRTLSRLIPLENTFTIHYSYNFRIELESHLIFNYKQLLIRSGVNFDKFVIFCAATTRLSHKTWNLEYMAQTLNALLDKYDVFIIFNVCDDGFEKRMLDSLITKLNKPENLLVDTQACNLQQLALLISNCNLFFGNEGGPRHIAQALQIPALAIYPPGVSKNEWLPNPSEKFRGIEPADCYKADNPETLDYQQSFNLITPDWVIPELFSIIDTCMKIK